MSYKQNETRPMCGECYHFALDDKRTPVHNGFITSWHMGVCTVHDGEHHDRCEFCDGCKEFRYSHKAAIKAASKLPQVDVTLGHGKRGVSTKILCVTTGVVYPNMMMAAKSVGRTLDGIRQALRHSRQPDGSARCGGKVFRPVKEG